LLIQVQNENKTFRLLTSAFLWKASVFWFELILRISFPIKLRRGYENQAYVDLNFASDTVRLVEHAALFCLDVCSKPIAKRKGLVRISPDIPLLYSQRFPLLSSKDDCCSKTCKDCEDWCR